MIEIQKMSFAYRKQKQLFDNLSVEAPPGNIYGLLGKNGAGKTTLLKIIAGLRFPLDGTVKVFDNIPQQRDPHFLQEVCFIPEQLYVPPVKISVYEKMNAAFYPKFSSEEFDTYLKEFKLNKDMKLSKLSFGQKKKVLLSFGLATNSRLLILDEPTNGLDIPSKSQFRQLIAGAINEERIFIISTHQVRDLGNLIDPIIILDEGKVIFNETVERINKQLYFRMEYFNAEPQDVLYAERITGGYMCVNENVIGEDSEIDLEVLFNAVTQNKEKMGEIFRKEVKNEA